MKKRLEGGQERFQVKLSNRIVERGKAEFTGKGTASRRFDVNDPMGKVVLSIIGVGELDFGEVGQGRIDNLGFEDFVAVKDLLNQLGKGQVGFAGDEVIHLFSKRLAIDLVTDFRTADHELDFRVNPFDQRDDFQGLGGIPDINPETNNPGSLSQELFDDIDGAFVNRELLENRPVTPLTQVRHQIA